MHKTERQRQRNISISPVFGMLSIFPSKGFLPGHCNPKHSVIILQIINKEIILVGQVFEYTHCSVTWEHPQNWMVVQWHLYAISNNLEHYMKNITKVTDRKSPLQPKENAGF